MKKLSILTSILAMMLSFTACSDDNDAATDDNGGAGSEVVQDQFLVMFYGEGGENLDGSIVGNILQSLDAGSSDKVKLTYQYRFSKSFQSSEYPAIYHNILRFTADENPNFVDKVEIDKTTKDDYTLDMFAKNITATNFGDENYVMSSDTALTSFIKWSKAQYPNAKKTILILSDHGGGWTLLQDGAKDAGATISSAKTRAILFDDNDDNSFSIGDLKKAVSNAGNVDLLYNDACLMSTWEDIVGYSFFTKYFVGSLELAPGIGGNHYMLVKDLQKEEVTDDGLHTAAKNFVDDVIDNWWELSNRKNTDDPIYGDLACYDLSNIAAMFTILTEIRQTLVEKYTSTEDIPGTNGVKWQELIDQAGSQTLSASTYFMNYVKASILPQQLIDTLTVLGYNTITINNKKYDYYVGAQILQALRLTSNEDIENGGYLDQYYEVWKIMASETTDSYPISDFLASICDCLNSAGSSDKTFYDLDTKYINALKEFGYIRCTKPITSTTFDCEYQLCSPGVFLFPLNEKGWTDPENFTARYSDDIPNYTDALRYYQATDFDKQVKWSDFLKVLQFAPDIVSNPSREELR